MARAVRDALGIKIKDASGAYILAQGGYEPQVSGLQTFSGSLSAFVNYKRSPSGVASFSADLSSQIVSITQYQRDIDGAVSFSSDLSRYIEWQREALGSLNHLGDLDNPTHTKDVDGAVSFSGDLSRYVEHRRSVSGALTPIDDSVSEIVRRKIDAIGYLSFIGNLEGAIQAKVIDGTLSFTRILSKKLTIKRTAGAGSLITGAVVDNFIGGSMGTRATQFEFLLSGLRDPDDGEPLNGGSVEFYEVGTSTPKEVWTEQAKTNSYYSYTLDSNGVAELYGDGSYKVIVKDSTGATEYTFDHLKIQSNEFIVRTVTSSSVTVNQEDDLIIADSTNNNITVNLDDLNNFSRPVIIKKVSANNTVTVDGYGSQLIDGASTYSQTANGEAATFIPDISGGQWRMANDVAISLAGLTATVGEINTTCDGNTATAAEITAVCDGNTATATEIVKAADGIGVTIPRQKIVEIGDWNMDSTPTVDVAHGLTQSKIIGVRCVIRSDAGNAHVPLNFDDGGSDGGYFSVLNDNVVLYRVIGGEFDSLDYDSTSYNRGWIIIDYID